MLLPLLGACAVVGPFQGPEWEPVRGLLSQSRSCRDPRCCGNLLVLCLFLLWQVRRCWHQITRPRPSKRNVIKVQKRVASSTRRKAFFGLAPEFFSPGQSRGLDAHVYQWKQEQRWGYRRGLRAQHLFSPQHPCQGPPWGVDTPSEPIFYSSSFPSTCPLTQDSSWEAWRVPWCLRDGQTHSALETCQRIKRLLVLSQEKLVPLEHVLGTRPCPASTAVAISLPNSPPAHNLQARPRDSLPDTSNQQVGMPIWKSWAPWSESQTEGREQSAEIQDAEWPKHRESAGAAMETQATESLLSGNCGMEDGTETKALECRNQRVIVSVTDGELQVPGQENPMGEVEELGKKKQREAGGKGPPETQVHMGKDQEQLRRKTDAETQTPAWAGQDESGDAVEIQALWRKNEKEAQEEESQAQGPGKQGQTRGQNGEQAPTPEQGEQKQTGGDAGVETQPEPGRTKGQVGGEYALKTQSLAGVKQEDSVETRALGCAEQAHTRSEDVTESQAPAWKKQGQAEGEDAGKTQASRGKGQKLPRLAGQVRWGKQGLGMGEDAGVPLTSRKKFREIREADWVVIQAHWWERQKLAESGIDGKFKPDCWENQNQAGGEHRVERQAPEEGNQREDRTNTLAPKAENQGQLNDGTDMRTHSAGRKNEGQFGDESRTDIQALGERNLREFKGEAGTETQELGREGQSQLGNEFDRQTHPAKWESQEHTGGTEDANVQAGEAEHWGELARKTDVETCSAAWEEGEAAGESETGGSCFPGLGSLEEPGGENATETQASEKRSQGEVGSGDVRRIQGMSGEGKRPQRSKVHGKTCSSEWEKREETGGGNGEGIQMQGKRNLRGTTGEGRTEAHTRMGGDQGLSKRETDGEMQTQGPGNQNKGGEGETAEIQAVRRQRKYRAEDAGRSWVPRREDRGQAREGAAMAILQGDCPGREGPTGRRCSLAWPWPPALLGSGYGTLEQGQAVAVISVASALSPGMKPGPHWGAAFLLASGEGKHLASPGTAPAGEHRARVSPACQQAQPGSQRRRGRHRGVQPGEAFSLMQQLQNHRALAAPALPGGQRPHAATAQAGALTTLTTLPKWPSLKKSKRLLLESLMRRRIAHLTWGLPRRILESYLLFNFLGSSSLPWAWGRPGQQLPRQQERHREAQGSKPGFQAPERAPRVLHHERKSLKLPTQARALEGGRPHRSQPMSISISAEKPRRTGTPGGTREPQIQKEARRAKLPAPRTPRPAAEPRSWCGPGRVPEPPSGDSRGRKMTRPGVSQMADRVPSRVRTSASRVGQDHWKKESRCREAPEPPRLKRQPPPYGRRGSPGPAEAGGAGLQLSCSTGSSSFRGSATLLSKMSPSPKPARPPRPAPPLSLRHLTLLPAGGDPPGWGSAGLPTAWKRDLQPPERCCAGTALSGTRRPQGQEAPGDPNKAPRNPPVPQKFGFMKHLRCFLFHCGLRK